MGNDKPDKHSEKQIDLLQGTLDLLILKAVSLGPLHGISFVELASGGARGSARGHSRRGD